MRQRNTTRRGSSFPLGTVNAVWNKGKPVSGYNPYHYRKDSCGAWIERAQYGNVNAKRGWEIDHIRPVSAGGSDDLSNLQPLQWENNRHKADDYPRWSCSVSAA